MTRKRLSRRRSRVGLAIIALVLIVAGGSYYLLVLRDDLFGGGSTETPTDGATSPIEDSPLQDAIARTADAGIVDAESSVRLNAPSELNSGSMRRRFSGEGVLDMQGSLAAVDYDMGNVANAAGFFGHTEEMSVVYTDSSFAVTFAEMATVLPDEFEWMSYDLEMLSDPRAEAAGIGQLREIGLSDPRLGFALLHGAVDEGQPIEAEDAGAEPTDEHFSTEADVERALHIEPSSDIRAILRTLLEVLGVSTVEIEYSLDDEERFNHIAYSLSYPVAGASKELKLDVSVEFTGFDAGPIEEPEEDTVMGYEGYLNL